MGADQALALTIISAAVSIGIALTAEQGNNDGSRKQLNTEVSTKAPPPSKIAAMPPSIRDEAITEINKPGFVKANTNVRMGSGEKFSIIATLPEGAEVSVIGRVRGRNWYLVEEKLRDSQKSNKALRGYVFGDLLAIFQ